MGALSRIALLSFCATDRVVGGQAVMEGVMMRDRERLAVAVRKPDGSIVVAVRPWRHLLKGAIWKRPFIRGFPILVETLINGIKALNLSAIEAGEAEKGTELKSWHLVLTLIVAMAMAVGLFVVLPHLMSLGFGLLGIAGDLNSLSFHVWDGVFKFLIFIGYIAAISLLPDIRRVFQYHGAEHKVIWNFEQHFEVSTDVAMGMSRLHPRCGTTFLLFVLSLAIIVHAIVVPLLLRIWTPEHALIKHIWVLAVKLVLMIPISALAYELIKVTARMHHTILGTILRAPGLFLQFLTTREPDSQQIEVALVALKEALGDDAPVTLRTPEYHYLENS